MKHPVLFIFSLVFFLMSPISYGTSIPLKVGTTGDYNPLTIKIGTSYTGYSIEVIRKFAKSEGYQIKFVPTTWGMLSTDLAKGKFTIAVGGISKNPERSSRFLLTDAVTSSGKIALIRCRDRKKFSGSEKDLIKQLNQPSIKFVENKGGTNSAFARKNFPDANITYVKDNHMPFVYLIKEKADVMITDLLEGNDRSRHGKYAGKLCVANPHDTFDHFDKVFMATKDNAALVKQFNQWLQKPETKIFLKKNREAWLN